MITVTGNFQEILASVKQYLASLNLPVKDEEERPWGGFVTIEDYHAREFIHALFPNEKDNQISARMSPKVLMVAPGKRLSFQWHKKRSEEWYLIAGDAHAIMGAGDLETHVQHFKTDNIIFIFPGTRHRLVGGKTWGIVAEIWHHKDPSDPSDEKDIIRVSDDHGRVGQPTLALVHKSPTHG